jgi:hypothetical protein
MLLVLAVSVVTALCAASSALAWTVEVTAVPKLKRTYAWKIEKSVDTPSLTLEAGTTADVTYTVTATPTGSVDSGWSVAGKVTMNPDAKIDVAALRVLIEPELTPATVDCLPAPFPVNLGASGLACDFSAPLADASGPRNAWMRATQVNGNVRNARAAFDFTAPQVDEVDESVTVTDSTAGTLGTVAAADGAKTFTYTRTIGPFATAECGETTVDNTAVYTTVDSGRTGSAGAAVAVTVTCPPPPPPPPPATPKCALPSLVWGWAALVGSSHVKPLLPLSLGTPGGARTVAVTGPLQTIAILAKELTTTNGVDLLATELLAAKLNAASGRDVSAIASTMAAADAFLATTSTSSWSGQSSAARAQVKSWTATLEAYNNRCVPESGGGDGHSSCKKHWDKPGHDWNRWNWKKYDWDE